MPCSSTVGKPWALDQLRLAVASGVLGGAAAGGVLDVGPGAGTWRSRVAAAGLRLGPWTGLEVFEPYITEYDLLGKGYRSVIVADARDSAVVWPKVDLVILGDVLEHMARPDAAAVVVRARSVSRLVLVSVPTGHWPQGASHGNGHEAHLGPDWSADEIEQRFGKWLVSAKHYSTISVALLSGWRLPGESLVPPAVGTGVAGRR